FGVIRDELSVSDSVASKQLKVLVDAGYVKLESKVAKSSRRPRMWASLTPLGRVACSEDVQKAQEIMTGSTRDQTLNRNSTRCTAIRASRGVPGTHQPLAPRGH